MGKYNAKKTVVDGMTFDSTKEAERWKVLRRLEQDGRIHDLRRQVQFELIPAQKESGRVVERPLTYIADFCYTTADGEELAEDVKPTGKDGKVSSAYKRTPAWREYVIKRKLMLYIKGIRVREV